MLRRAATLTALTSLAATLLVGVGGAAHAVPPGTLDESTLVGAHGTGAYSIEGGQWLAAQLSPSRCGTLTGVQLSLMRVGTPPNSLSDLTVAIRSDAGGLPGGVLTTAVLTKASIAFTPVAVYDVTFASPVSTAPGTPLWLALQATGGAGGLDSYGWVDYPAATAKPAAYSLNQTTWLPSPATKPGWASYIQDGPCLTAITATANNTTIGGQLTAGGTLSPTEPVVGGTVGYTAWFPGDTTCTGPVAHSVSNLPVTSATLPTTSFTPTTAGLYRWKVFYSGDASHASAESACGSATSLVAKVTPTLTTQATTTATVGGTITDVATIAGGSNPTGSLVFTVYGPNDPNCTGAPWGGNSGLPVNGNGNVQGPIFTVNQPGTFRWVVSYSGDVNNNFVTGACNDANETSVVSAATPTLTTQATPTATVGGTITDTATLSGGFNPTGTMSFALYGPNDPNCAGAPYATSTGIAVNGNGQYQAGIIQANSAGTYRWIASYNGDANNAPVTGACNDANETSVVGMATPTISTQATPTAAVGAPISDTATLTGGFNPTGTVDFHLYAPGDTVCATPIFSSTARPLSSGTATSAPYSPAQSGTYRWRAFYSGDANNVPVNGACNAPNEATVVIDSADLVATKSGPGTVTAGQSYTYTVGVTNNGPSTASNVVLTDTLPAGVTFVSAPGCTANGQVLTCPIGTLTSGQSASRTITVTPDVTNPFGTALTNTVTVSSSTADPNTANNTATVTSSQTGCTTTSTMGTAGNDVFCPGTSGRTINGLGGNDVIYGSPGGDTLQGGDGDDVLFGGGGNDTLQGGNGNDRLYGQDGNDTLQGGAGTDFADGGPGTDTGQQNESQVAIPDPPNPGAMII